MMRGMHASGALRDPPSSDLLPAILGVLALCIGIGATYAPPSSIEGWSLFRLAAGTALGSVGIVAGAARAAR